MIEARRRALSNGATIIALPLLHATRRPPRSSKEYDFVSHSLLRDVKRGAHLGAFMVTPRVLPPVALIDDNPDDLFFMQQRLQRAGIANPIIAYGDGEEAMSELAKCGRSPEQPVPCVLFLDLRMPRCGGFEVLKWVREQPALDAMRVVIVSTSALPEDAARAIRLGAIRFLTKYPTPELLGQIVAEAMRGTGGTASSSSAAR